MGVGQRGPHRGVARVTMQAIASRASVKVRRLAAVVHHRTVSEDTDPVSPRAWSPTAALKRLLAAIRHIPIATAELAATFGAVAPEHCSRSSRAWVPVY